jgi:hypothetical protein
MFEKIINILRKLRILRFGTTKYEFKDGKVPIQSLMDDVNDPQKDLMFDLDRKKDNKNKKED